MEIHNPSDLSYLPATMASGEQIQAIVNAQLAVANNELQQSLNQKFATANMELQQSLDQRFGSFKSEIDASIVSIASDLSDLRNKLNEVTRHAEITYESQKKEMGEAIERMNVNINRADEEAVKNGQKINEALTEIPKHIQGASNTYTEFQSAISNRVGAVERALSTAVTVAQQASPANTSASSSSTTLDNDKRFIAQTILNGEKDPSTIQEWWTKLLIKIEQAIPTSEEYLKSAMRSKVVIDNDLIESGSNKIIGHKLNRELYSLLTNKTTKKAWGHIKNLQSHQGLEAFRVMYQETTMKGPAQLQSEHRYLNNPTDKPKNNSDLPQWIREWEHRIKELSAASSDYDIPNAQKRNILYQVLPQQLKQNVDTEIGKGNLMTYDQLKEFTKTAGLNERRLHQTTPVPLSLNSVAEEPEVKYIQKEWFSWLNNGEGQEYIRNSPNDEVAMKMLGSMAAQATGKGFWQS